MRKILCILFVFFAANGFSQIQVTDSTKISLITCSPAQEAVYTRFGHTAIRYQDVSTGTDLMFNYGIFNFNTPNFIGRFIKGETDYELGVYPSEYFFKEYRERNSQVTQQELNLTQGEKQRLIDALQVNYQPENRVYRYNFIFDNCATRPRVKVEEAVNGKIIYSLEETHYYTFRHWIGKYVGFYSWTKFGIDLLLGKETDRLATQMEATFLPDVLMEEFDHAQIKTTEGTTRSLVKSEEIPVLKTSETESQSVFFGQPAYVMLLVLLIGLALTYAEFVKKKNWRVIDSVLLFITGLAGVIIFYLMFFSVHPLVKSNYNILWCNPLNIFIAVFIWIKKERKVSFFFQSANVLLFIGAFLVFIFSIQHINAASVPLILLLLVRSAFWLYKERDILQKNSKA